MKMVYKILTISSISLFLTINLSGCSSLMSSKMPTGSVSMEQTYNEAIDGSNDEQSGGSMDQVRAKVKNISLQSSDYTAYTRTAENEIDNQFPQLPNPNIVMYVYPHQAGEGNNQTPVPGYSTVFPLYDHVVYAMPGEVAPQP